LPWGSNVAFVASKCSSRKSLDAEQAHDRQFLGEFTSYLSDTQSNTA